MSKLHFLGGEWAALRLLSVSRECLVPILVDVSSLHSLADNNQPETSLQKCSMAVTGFPVSQENVPVSQ